jgi:hypothetical protein
MSIKLYEFECSVDCSTIMQVQTEADIDGIMVCICGSPMDKVFRTEIDESVFGQDSEMIISTDQETPIDNPQE